MVDIYGWDFGGGHRQLTSSRGDLAFFTMPVARPGEYSAGHVAFPASGDVADLGDRVAPGVRAYDDCTVRFVAAAHWLVAVPLAAAGLPAAVRFRRWRRARRSRPGGLLVAPAGCRDGDAA
ncbi:MAG: hypothetical protein JWO31_2140 [Phycisphaerales bacterium]|nr:hypothetical protein [Phycisphaerales bacterium]